MIEVIPATAEHAEFLAPRLRVADRAEVLAGGQEPLWALLHSMGSSFEAFTYTVDGRPVAMWGAASDPTDWTCTVVWMLGSDEVAQHAKDVLRMPREWLRGLQLRFVTLRCAVHDQHTVSRRWLKRLGFQERCGCVINGSTFIVCDRRA